VWHRTMCTQQPTVQATGAWGVSALGQQCLGHLGCDAISNDVDKTAVSQVAEVGSAPCLAHLCGTLQESFNERREVTAMHLPSQLADESLQTTHARFHAAIHTVLHVATACEEEDASLWMWCLRPLVAQRQARSQLTI
jgi:hypothetical protein